MGIAIWLASKQRQLFDIDMPVFIDQFYSDSSIRRVIENYYGELVSSGTVVAIEKLPAVEKYNLKQLAISLSLGKLDQDGKIQLCKCLQVMRHHKII